MSRTPPSPGSPVCKKVTSGPRPDKLFPAWFAKDVYSRLYHLFATSPLLIHTQLCNQIKEKVENLDSGDIDNIKAFLIELITLPKKLEATKHNQIFIKKGEPAFNISDLLCELISDICSYTCLAHNFHIEVRPEDFKIEPTLKCAFFNIDLTNMTLDMGQHGTFNNTDTCLLNNCFFSSERLGYLQKLIESIDQEKSKLEPAVQASIERKLSPFREVLRILVNDFSIDNLKVLKTVITQIKTEAINVFYGTTEITMELNSYIANLETITGIAERVLLSNRLATSPPAQSLLFDSMSLSGAKSSDSGADGSPPANFLPPSNLRLIYS